MDGIGKLGRALHEEHFWTLVVLTGLEERLTNGNQDVPLDPNKAADRSQLEELLTVLDDMMRHHAFEEGVLFPTLWGRGASDITILFTNDHAAIGPLTTRLRKDTRALLAGVEEDGLWERFRTHLLELAEQAMIHLQKEETVLIRRLGSLLGERLDEELAARFLAEKQAGQGCGPSVPGSRDAGLGTHV